MTTQIYFAELDAFVRGELTELEFDQSFESAESEDLEDLIACDCGTELRLEHGSIKPHSSSCPVWDHPGYAVGDAEWDHINCTWIYDYALDPMLAVDDDPLGSYEDDYSDWKFDKDLTGISRTRKISHFVQKCRHYGQMLILPDGYQLLCSSEHRRKDGESTPDFGCYMTTMWEPEWLSYTLPWADYGLPKVPTHVLEGVVDELFSRIQAGQTVEIGCMGGHGRTGTLAALILVRCYKLEAKEAIAYVHDNYCHCAIEGRDQEWLIEAWAAQTHGRLIPARPVPPEPIISKFSTKKDITEPTPTIKPVKEPRTLSSIINKQKEPFRWACK